MTIELTLPDGALSNGEKANVNISNGNIILTRQDGSLITPSYMKRDVAHNRAKGSKSRTQYNIQQGHVSIGGLKELSKFDKIFFIDTNTKVIDEEKVSISCFIVCRLLSEGAGYRFHFEKALHAFEFRNVTNNPECLAILKIAHDVSITSKEGQQFAIVTDTELGLHDQFNRQEKPIYGEYYLPNNFKLLYASADTGQEGLNRIFKFCDAEATKTLEYLVEGSIKCSPLFSIIEDPSAIYRYMSRTDVEFSSQIISEIKIEPKSKIRLYGKRKKNTEE
ncbi:MAG: hypothetical protein KAS59_00445 [Alphaproteobacteria bacterium]|nr:hypothetical protein [Alphaproteobacteria bacterium]MCK5554714.1 hypothetical protein [Alphaproteobacteria bacterium]